MLHKTILECTTADSCGKGEASGREPAKMTLGAKSPADLIEGEVSGREPANVVLGVKDRKSTV